MTATPGVNPTTFRTDYPEFANTTNYPDAVINYYIVLAGMLLNPARWGQPTTGTPVAPPTSMFDMATELFVAHNIVLEFQAQVAASKGAAPGLVSGPMSSKSVGPISASYDTGAVTAEGASVWNSTVYGTRLWRLIQMFGAGPVYIGPAAWCGGAFLNMGSGWQGPPPWPGWFSS